MKEDVVCDYTKPQPSYASIVEIALVEHESGDICMIKQGERLGLPWEIPGSAERPVRAAQRALYSRLGVKLESSTLVMRSVSPRWYSLGPHQPGHLGMGIIPILCRFTTQERFTHTKPDQWAARRYGETLHWGNTQDLLARGIEAWVEVHEWIMEELREAPLLDH